MLTMIISLLFAFAGLALLFYILKACFAYATWLGWTVVAYYLGSAGLVAWSARAQFKAAQSEWAQRKQSA